jgi:hypothetical protein
MKSLFLTALLVGCVPPPPAQQVTYTQPAQAVPYAQPQPMQSPAEHAAEQSTRQFTFNGRAATPEDLQTLAQIEQLYGQRAPDGDYWYDARSGAAGKWNGPTLGFLPAGLALGGPLPANASGGGDGRTTGIFINGRELHPVDRQVLIAIYGQAFPGRWWVDGQGNAGQEGGPALLNLVAVARQRGSKSADSYYRTDGKGNNAFVGGGCVTSSSTTGSGYDKKTHDYYGAGC